jgi:dihydroorotase
MTNPLCLRGGRVLDPARGVDTIQDLWIENGTIAGLDVKGAVVAPGFVDIHVHLREPGQEEKETIETGTRAAVRGGFTTVACMPNTTPPLDDRPRVEYVVRRAKESGACRVLPIAAVTVGQMGESLVEFDGKPVRNAEIMRRALELTKPLGVPVIQHAEDPDLKGSGVVHEGWVSTRVGLKGIPDIAESVMVARDVLLADVTGGRVHVAHMSAARTVEVLRWAKSRGIPMTGETTPHHLVLTDEAVSTYDTNTKMNPPLRTARDRDALIQGVIDGTIDCLATDHAPHTDIEKDGDFDGAPFGIVGLETALGLYLKALVEPKHLSLAELILRMTVNPLRVLGRDGGTLARGAAADVTVFDPAQRFTVRAGEFASKARNMPFEGWELPGRILSTLVNGRVAYRADTMAGSVR